IRRSRRLRRCADHRDGFAASKKLANDLVARVTMGLRHGVECTAVLAARGEDQRSRRLRRLRLTRGPTPASPPAGGSFCLAAQTTNREDCDGIGGATEGERKQVIRHDRDQRLGLAVEPMSSEADGDDVMTKMQQHGREHASSPEAERAAPQTEKACRYD